MLEITTALLYCCLCIAVVCGTAGLVCLTYVHISNMLKKFKHNEQPIGDHFYDP
jgi:hypothetical protein